MDELQKLSQELSTLNQQHQEIEQLAPSDNELSENDGESCLSCEHKDELVGELLDIISGMSNEEVDKIVDYALTLIEPNYNSEQLENQILAEAGRHISAKQKIKNKIRRRQPRVQLALKKRRMRNKMCPPGTSWSSKTNSCTRIDPKRSLAMRRAALYRRSF